MKVSVTSYSFNQLTSKGACSELGLIALAKEMGFEGIEFSGINPPDGEDKRAYAERLSRECKKQDIPCVSYTIGADFINGSDGSLEAEIERLKGEVDICEFLGAPLMRHDAAWGYKGGEGKYMGFENALPRLIEGCRAVTRYAKTKGIRTMTENHGYFCQESVRVERLINGVADENFGALIDIGNFMCADEDSAAAVGRLAPYAFHVHAKDFHKKSGNLIAPCDGFFRTRGGAWLRGAIVGHGEVPVYQCLQTLKNSGYDGYVTVEFEGIEDAETGVRYGLNTVNKLLSLI